MYRSLIHRLPSQLFISLNMGGGANLGRDLVTYIYMYYGYIKLVISLSEQCRAGLFGRFIRLSLSSLHHLPFGR